MWARGLSASEISNELGYVTRCAVLGKVDRLGLTGRRTVFRLRKDKKVRPQREPKPRPYLSTKKNHIRETPAQRIAKRGARVVAAEQKAAAFEAIEVVELAPEQTASAVSLFDLESRHCRWPLGDPRDLEAMRFCGADKFGEHPYCRGHCRMAYQPRAVNA